MSNDELYDEPIDASEGMDSMELGEGIVDTGDLDDQVAPELPANAEYKLKVVSCGVKPIEWNDKKTGEPRSADILELIARIIDSEYKNPMAVKDSIFLPDDSMNEQQRNSTKGKIIRMKEGLFGPEGAKERGFNYQAAMGVEFYADVYSKDNKKDKTRKDVLIKKYKLA